MNIKVLGSGCPNCKKLNENTKQAILNLKIDATVEYVTDLTEIMNYGVMRTPALVIDEKVVSMGKDLDAGAIEKIINERI